MNDILAHVFEEAEAYILHPIQPDEVTPYMMADADPHGASVKVWTDRLNRMAKDGRAIKVYRYNELNRRVVAYRMVSNDND